MFSVLHILNKYDLSEGGPPRSIYNLLVGLKKRGIKTYLISTSKNNLKKNNLVFLGKNFLDRFSLPNLSLIFHLKKKIKEFDIIHIHCMWNFITTISLYFAIYYKKKIIFSPHGTLDKHNIKKNFFLKKIYYYLIEKKNIKKINLIHFLSYEEKKNSKYLEKKKYFVVNNGLNLNKFNILSFGRFNKIKGLDIQLKLIKKLNHKENKFLIFFIGPENKEKRNLIYLTKKMKIENSVVFLPPVYSDKRFQILHDSDLIINTSYYECNSMTILESIASGALVLAVDKANVDHQFKYKALIKTKRNLGNISKIIKSLKNNKKKQLKIRKNATLYATRFLNINALTNKYLEQYKLLIKS